jgi:periplasmic divalent cation tolerance protein
MVESSHPDDPILVYITTASVEQAHQIGLALVAESLAACVNIIPGMQSIYRWQGQVEEGAETVVIAKSVQSRFDALQQRVVDLHSAETPCIVAWPLTASLPAFRTWIIEQTK